VYELLLLFTLIYSVGAGKTGAKENNTKMNRFAFLFR
jgi:hypothetical protein